MTGVLHTFINAVDFGLGIQAAVDAPRIHCQGQETVVDERVPEAVRQRLAEMGHEVVVVQEDPGSTNFGRIASIWRDPKTGALHGGSGPAWNTAAAGY